MITQVFLHTQMVIMLKLNHIFHIGASMRLLKVLSTDEWMNKFSIKECYHAMNVFQN